MNLEQLQLLAQLIDSMEIGIDKLEQAYQDNDSEDFQTSKQTIFDFHQKINSILQQK